jgi:hypothetical protein
LWRLLSNAPRPPNLCSPTLDLSPLPLMSIAASGSTNSGAISELARRWWRVCCDMRPPTGAFEPLCSDALEGRTMEGRGGSHELGWAPTCWREWREWGFATLPSLKFERNRLDRITQLSLSPSLPLSLSPSLPLLIRPPPTSSSVPEPATRHPRGFPPPSGVAVRWMAVLG